jgi:hypothetical protein
MSFLGNTPTTQSFTSLTERFNGDGSTTTVTLSRAVYNASDIEVLVNNVQQDPYDAYTVNGTQTLTFTEAPSSGTGNIIVTYRNYTITKFVPAEGTVTAAAIATGAITGDKVAVGTLTGNLFADGTITGQDIAANTIGSSNLTITGVSAGTYGGTGNTPSLIIDAQGRVTAAINVATTSSGGGTSSAKSIILNAVFGG